MKNKYIAKYLISNGYIFVLFPEESLNFYLKWKDTFKLLDGHQPYRTKDSKTLCYYEINISLGKGKTWWSEIVKPRLIKFGFGIEEVKAKSDIDIIVNELVKNVIA